MKLLKIKNFLLFKHSYRERNTRFPLSSIELVRALTYVLMSLSATSVLAATSSSSSSDPSGLASALARGDRSAVQVIERRIEAGPVTRKINQAQLNYAMGKLLELAKSCEVGALKASALEASLRCNTIARGVAMASLGDLNEYFKESAWAKNKLFPAIMETPGGKAVFGDALDTIDLTAFATSTPALSQKIVSKSKSLFVVNQVAEDGYHAPPAINITVNGHEISAFVDTGIGVNVIVTQSVARKLDLSKILGNFTAAQYLGGGSNAGWGGVYMAKSIEVGPLLLHNLLVSVLPDGSIPAGTYIGMAMLRRFKEVTITNKQINLSMAKTLKCETPIPMTFASDTSEAGKLLFSISANHRPANAQLDTGSSFLLLGSSDFFPYAMTSSTHRGQVGETSIQISVGNSKIKSEHAIILKGDTVADGSSVIIGNPLLESFKLVLHLQDPSFCLVSNVP